MMESFEKAFDIISYIVDGDLKPGDKLPSIRTLASQMDCSPSEIRSGLITCSALGMIQTHPRAGSFLSCLDNKKIASLFSLLIKFGMDYSYPAIMDIYHLKTMLDAELFPLAAKYRTQEELIELRQSLDEQERYVNDPQKFIELDEAFHSKVASISRNQLAATLVSTLQAMLREDRLKNQKSSQARPFILEDHHKLYEAILEQNSERIAELARQHSLRRIKELSVLAGT